MLNPLREDIEARGGYEAIATRHGEYVADYLRACVTAWPDRHQRLDAEAKFRDTLNLIGASR